MSIEAMNMALEALTFRVSPDKELEAITVLRPAIEQAEKQEPRNEHGFSDRTKTSRDICGND